MENIWEAFENMTTVDEVKEAISNSYEKPTEGEHRVKLLSIEPTLTQQGYPQVKFRFKDCNTNGLIIHSMFLTNNNYPDQTPKAIASVINFVKNITGKELTFVSIPKLADEFSNMEFDDNDIIINVSYKTPDAKYPIIKFVERIGNDNCIAF